MPRRARADIFADQAGEPRLLAAIYDLEHDRVKEDLAFYGAAAAGADRILDLGCGSGRLFGCWLTGQATEILGIDGSAALLERARQRVAAQPTLRAAARAGRLRLKRADVRQLGRLRIGAFDLVVAAGVLPHMEDPTGAGQVLAGIRARLAPTGRAILDDLGPRLIPDRDLPLSFDWRRTWEGRTVVRRSQLVREGRGDGLAVTYATLTEIREPDGTITRLSASHRLWYPSTRALAGLLAAAGLTVEERYGSHRLAPFHANSERRIVIVRRTAE